MKGFMAKDGIPFLLVPVLGALFCLALGWWLPGFILALLGCGLGLFFRDPDRPIPQEPGLIVSPADGKVIQLVQSADGTVISIFLSIFNVHVTRAPIGGIIQDQEYRAGRFRFAFDNRAPKENERMKWEIEGQESVTFFLVAGWVARRIVAWKRRGDRVDRGDRIGLIRFGSRVDITVPPDFLLVVGPGDRVRGGSSILASREMKRDRTGE